jgi:hypothetical protein
MTAVLPLKHQMIPGIALLITAPVLLFWTAMAYGWIWLCFGLFAFVSMFRRPLIYFARSAFGLPTDRPDRPE